MLRFSGLNHVGEMSPPVPIHGTSSIMTYTQEVNGKFNTLRQGGISNNIFKSIFKEKFYILIL